MATSRRSLYSNPSKDLIFVDVAINFTSNDSSFTEENRRLKSKSDVSKPIATSQISENTIQQLYRHIDQMTPKQLQEELTKRNLSGSGAVQIRRFRLKNYHRLKSLYNCADPFNMIEQPFEYIAVVDFEATCENNSGENYRHEIIEFPIVLIDVQKRTIVDKFQSYCRPLRNPILSKFCTELTGIRQYQVDRAPPFSDVLGQVEAWLYERNLLSPNNKSRVAFATDGPWDFAKFLSIQCASSSIPFPLWAKKWIDIRQHFAEFYSYRRTGIEKMLNKLGLDFDGRPHSGIDDATNIARIAVELLKDGCVLSFNDSL